MHSPVRLKRLPTMSVPLVAIIFLLSSLARVEASETNNETATDTSEFVADLSVPLNLTDDDQHQPSGSLVLDENKANDSATEESSDFPVAKPLAATTTTRLIVANLVTQSTESSVTSPATTNEVSAATERSPNALSSSETTTTTVEEISTTPPEVTTTSTSAPPPSTTIIPSTTATTSAATTAMTTTTTTTASTTTLATAAVTVPLNESVPSVHLDTNECCKKSSTNCSHFPLSPQQPVYDKDSLIKKCCPFGEIFAPVEGRLRCIPGERALAVEVIFAVFYGDDECIVDKENKLHFNYEANDSCRSGRAFEYSKDQGDELYVIQNGSLLVIEAGGGYVTAYDRYCVEVDINSKLLAKVCDIVEPSAAKTPMVLIYVGLSIASLLLLMTCLAYGLIPKLNDIFGRLITVHAGTFLVGLILICLAICEDKCIPQSSVYTMQVFGQLFLMSSVYIFLLMNIYNCAYAVYYLENGYEFQVKNKRDEFVVLIVLYTITIIPLFLPWRNALIFDILLGIYYSVIAVILYFSHRKLRSMTYNQLIVSQRKQQEMTFIQAVNAPDRIDGNRLTEIRSSNRLCTVEAIFTLAWWVVFSSLRKTDGFEQDDFSQVAAAYAVIFQGMLIGVLYVGGRKKWTIIRECWHNSGSLDLRALETERELKTLERNEHPPL